MAILCLSIAPKVAFTYFFDQVRLLLLNFLLLTHVVFFESRPVTIIYSRSSLLNVEAQDDVSTCLSRSAAETSYGTAQHWLSKATRVISGAIVVWVP